MYAPAHPPLSAPQDFLKQLRAANPGIFLVGEWFIESNTSWLGHAMKVGAASSLYNFDIYNGLLAAFGAKKGMAPNMTALREVGAGAWGGGGGVKRDTSWVPGHAACGVAYALRLTPTAREPNHVRRASGGTAQRLPLTLAAPRRLPARPPWGRPAPHTRRRAPRWRPTSRPT